MQRFEARYNRFDGGVTSELRFDYETKRFARLWNFNPTPDRMIQHHGMVEVLDKPGHIVEYRLGPLQGDRQEHVEDAEFVVIDKDCDITFVLTDCTPGAVTISMLNDQLEMAVQPIQYDGFFIFQTSGGNVYAYNVTNNELAAQFPIGVATQIFASETFDTFTFFLDAGPFMVVFANDKVHIWDNGNLLRTSVSGSIAPITQFMVSGDVNGEAGKYTVGGIPIGQVINQVDDLQNILNVLGYGPIPVDGLFGPLTNAAVQAFQADNVATGNAVYLDGSPADPQGTPLVVDGLVGPETSSALNYAWSTNTNYEILNVFDGVGPATAVTMYGSYISWATQDLGGDANVHMWNGALDTLMTGYSNVISSSKLEQGIVQALNVLDGSLVAIMSPANTAKCAHHYNELRIYEITAHVDNIPPARPKLLAKYLLKTIPGPEDDTKFSFNYVNRKTLVRGGRMYFTGRIHLQHIEASVNDEGAFSGVMSIDPQGNLFTEVTHSTASDDWSDDEVISFTFVDSGFAISGNGKTHMTSQSESDTVSGFITSIVDGGYPYLDKTIDNIYLGLHNASDIDKIEIWIREVEDVYDNDAGWQLAYDSDSSSPVGEPTTENKFRNRVIINRLENGQRFAKFREMQVMVKIFGYCGEITELNVTGYVNDINK